MRTTRERCEEMASHCEQGEWRFYTWENPDQRRSCAGLIRALEARQHLNMEDSKELALRGAKGLTDERLSRKSKREDAYRRWLEGVVRGTAGGQDKVTCSWQA